MSNDEKNARTNNVSIGQALEELTAITSKIHERDQTENVRTNEAKSEEPKEPKVRKSKPRRMHLKPAHLESSDDKIIFKKGRTDRISMRVTPAEKKALTYLADFHDLNLTNYFVWLAKQDAKRRRLVNRIKERGGDLD